MGKKLTAIFEAQDRMTNVLAGIEQKGKRVTSSMSSAKSAISGAFDSTPAERFARNMDRVLDDTGRNAGRVFDDMSKDFDGSMDNMYVSVSELEDYLQGFGEGFADGFNEELERMGQESREAERHLGGLDSRAGSLTGTLKKAAGVIATVFTADKLKDFAVESTNAFGDFDAGMKEVNTLLAGATKKELAEMSDMTRQFSKDNAKLTSESIPALYNALSAGVPKDNVFDFMSDANKLAVGGVAELNSSVAVLSTITNNYKDMNLGAGEAADLLFTTVKKGVTSIPELASSIGEVVPSAAAAKVAFSDVTAGMATLTSSLGYGSTAKATTKFRSMLDELSTTGSEVDKTFRKISGSSFPQFISQGGNMQDALGMLNDYATDSNLSIKELFSSVEAGGAALILGSTGAATFAENVADMERSAGAATEAYDTMTSGLNYRKQQIATLWEGTKLDIGAGFAESMEPAAESLIENYALIEEPMKEFFSGLADIAAEMVPLIPKMMDGLNTGFKKLKSVAMPVLGWVEEHPTLVKSVIAGIGATIVSSKIAGGLTATAAGIGTLGASLIAHPWLAVGAAVVGGITAIAVAIEDSRQAAAQANLEEHFGSIALSMDQLDEAAAHILQTENLSGLSTMMDSLDSMKGFEQSMKDSLAEINRMNWKVSVGMELSASEQEQYQAAINQYISDVQGYVEEQQIAVNIAVGILTNDDELGQGIIYAVNSFYENKKDELAGTAKQLRDYVNEAFNEGGVFGFEEAQEVARLQKQMADIQSKLATSQFEAELEMLDMKFGGELSPESFMQLQEELARQTQEAVGNLDESLKLSIANAQVMLEDGAINDDQYQMMVDEYKANYLEQVGDLELRASSFHTDTILQQFDGEIGAIVPEMGDRLNTALGETINYIDWSGNAVGGWSYDQIAQWLDIDGLDRATTDALKELWVNLEPQLAEMQALKEQYLSAGKEIPEELSKGILDTSAIGILIGDQDALFAGLAEAAKSSPEHMAALEGMKESGIGMPEAMSTGIAENQIAIDNSVKESWRQTQELIRNTFGTGMDIPVPIHVQMNPVYGKSGKPTAPYSNEYLANLPGHAEGGIFDTPHIAYFAEDGPEAAIPLDGSARAFALWEEAGRILGKFNRRAPDSGGQEAEDAISLPSGTRSRKDINVNVNCNGRVVASGGLRREDVVDLMIENMRTVFLQLVEEEEFVEGDLAYEY